jgi:hypothetical protein
VQTTLLHKNNEYQYHLRAERGRFGDRFVEVGLRNLKVLIHALPIRRLKLRENSKQQ